MREQTRFGPRLRDRDLAQTTWSELASWRRNFSPLLGAPLAHPMGEGSGVRAMESRAGARAGVAVHPTSTIRLIQGAGSGVLSLSPRLPPDRCRAGGSFDHHDLEGLFAPMRLILFFVHRRGRRRNERIGAIGGERFFSLVKFDADNLADALFLHGDAIEHIGHSDRPLVVSDNDELRMRQEPLQDADEPVNV